MESWNCQRNEIYQSSLAILLLFVLAAMGKNPALTLCEKEGI